MFTILVSSNEMELGWTRWEEEFQTVLVFRDVDYWIRKHGMNILKKKEGVDV